MACTNDEGSRHIVVNAFINIKHGRRSAELFGAADVSEPPAPALMEAAERAFANRGATFVGPPLPALMAREEMLEG